MQAFALSCVMAASGSELTSSTKFSALLAYLGVCVRVHDNVSMPLSRRLSPLKLPTSGNL